jgi:hypothetical protein
MTGGQNTAPRNGLIEIKHISIALYIIHNK